MKSFKVKINLKALEYAINSSGYTVGTLASKVKTKRITVDYLNDIISKKKAIYYSELKKLDSILKKGVPFYFLKEFPIDKTFTKFRKNNTRYRISPEVERKIRDYDILREEINILMKNEEITPVTNLKKYSRVNPVEKIALELRKRFNFENLNIEKLSSGEVFEYLREMIEKSGPYIFKDNLLENKVRGLILSGNALPPLILINSNDDKNAEIFSLLHEYAHFLLGDDEIDIDSEDIVYNKKFEEWCNSFAYSFMITREIEIKENFNVENRDSLINPDSLNKLSKKYKISKHSLMYRFYKLGIISLGEYSFFKNEYPIKPYRKKTTKGGNYYNMIKSRISKNFVRLVYENYSSGNISINSAMDYLKVKEPERIDYMMEGIKI